MSQNKSQSQLFLNEDSDNRYLTLSLSERLQLNESRQSSLYNNTNIYKAPNNRPIIGNNLPSNSYSLVSNMLKCEQSSNSAFEQYTKQPKTFQQIDLMKSHVLNTSFNNSAIINTSLADNNFKYFFLTFLHQVFFFFNFDFVKI
jgi:hypothetical protein